MAESNQNREDEKSYITVTNYKNHENIGGKIRPENQDKTRLHELSLLKNIYFGAIHYYIHLDMNLDFTISRIFFRTRNTTSFNHLCKIVRAQILESLALPVLKILHAGYLYEATALTSLIMKKTFFGTTLAPKKVSELSVFENKRCYQCIPIF